MIRACARCRQTFDSARTAGVCPHCGHTGNLPSSVIVLLGLAALAAVAVGAGLLLGPLRPGVPAPPPSPAAPEIPDTEFPAARATIRPPRDWRYVQRDAASVAFSEVFGSAAIRFRAVGPTEGRDAHLALVKEVVPGAEPAEFALPDWPGAESIAVRTPGDPRIGASWLIHRGETALQVLFWGAESALPAVSEFRTGLRLHDAPPPK